ncbi:MAG: phosphatase PAP2 family protein [Clostridiaceae bacterium]|jgi:undecaprenyl-diphosphatase|nr:phosphatase PAP2 family protein [Clostridiaceae bacterium]
MEFSEKLQKLRTSRNMTKIQSALLAVSSLIIIITAVGRLISGVHWFTDIIGGILISTMLLAVYSEIIGN